MTSTPPDPLHPDPLAELRSRVTAARSQVRALRAGAVDRDQLQGAHALLLSAMEAYAAELDRRRLPIPPTLRDDIRLYREIGVSPSPARPYRPRSGT
jgi:hypothetical protein